MRPRPLEFADQMAELFDLGGKQIRSVTLQVTDACNLCCTYCYQGHKGGHVMDFETAKKFLDTLLDGDAPYINLDNTAGITLELIGGEPLLAIDLIDQVTAYFLGRMIRENHPWLFRSRISICSNGVLYFDKKVQKYLEMYRDWVSFSVSVDGNRSLHDACRVFPDGSGSYDLAIAAAKDYMRRYNPMLSTKLTLAPANVEYTAVALVGLVEAGYRIVYANCVFEEGWTVEHARTLYWQLKSFAEWLFSRGLHDEIYVSLFDEDQFCPLEPVEDQNWCGGTGEMIAVDWKGDIFPCLRYMESSLGDDVPPIIIGTVDGGLEATPEQREWVRCLQCVTRSSQSPEKCMSCPVAKGCAWCSAYNYQRFGTVDKRATFICQMHQARALANVYFWNRYYQAMGVDKRMVCHVPRDWALEIVPEAEFDRLLEMGGKST